MKPTISHQHDDTPMQQIDVTVRLTFEAPVAEETQSIHDRFSDYVRGGLQVFADSLTTSPVIENILEEAQIYGNDELGELVAQTIRELPEADGRMEDYKSHDHCDMSLETSINMVQSALGEFRYLLKDADSLLTREGKAYICNRFAVMVRNEEDVIREVLGLRDEEDEADNG